ncbi:MAG: phosphoribosylamine--glycine ligase [Kiritimatiellae bacterium]|nr:phosphoribosylamine--glycine ligase [Kiritimatiellia bacterium]
MKILVIGGGGREHAIAWRLSKDGGHEIYCAPGNAGTADIATNVPIGAEDIDDLVAWSQLARPDLVVVGPEAPLCLGVADRISALGIPVFGPSKEAARMEGSKSFSKEVMEAAGVPTAHAERHVKADEAIAALDRFTLPVVIKADGLAAGKGVIIAKTRAEAEDAIRSILDERQFGEAGASLLVETFLEGEEASILALVSGEGRIALLPPAQDHKRVFDNDEGPNTGGMGAYSPAPVVTDEVLDFAMERIFKPVVAELAKRGIEYRGVLYGGLMIGPAGINVLEFNCRFGDPETEAILPRIGGDFASLLLSCAKGELDPASLVILPQPCATVVMAAPGYPGKYPKGLPISGLDAAGAMADVTVFHAGTADKDGQTVTSGGRVLCVTALGSDLRDAVDKAYSGIRAISFEGAHYRKDIARRAFNR